MTQSAIELIKRADLTVVRFRSKVVGQDYTTHLHFLKKTLEQTAAKTQVALVFDFENAPKGFSYWAELQELLVGTQNLKLYAVKAPNQLRAEIASQSNLKMLWKDSFEDVLKEFGGKAFFAPAKYSEGDLQKLLVDAFQSATLTTFEIQASVEARAQAPYKKTKANRAVYDIAASMGLMGKFVSGAIALGFTEKVFLQVMSEMLAEQYDSLTEEVEDGCGEILNIIFGQAKKQLNEKGFLFGKTLPTIFVGNSLRVRQLTPSPVVVLPFETDFGRFYLELGYRKTS